MNGLGARTKGIKDANGNYTGDYEIVIGEDAFNGDTFSTTSPAPNNEKPFSLERILAEEIIHLEQIGQEVEALKNIPRDQWPTAEELKESAISAEREAQNITNDIMKRIYPVSEADDAIVPENPVDNPNDTRVNGPGEGVP